MPYINRSGNFVEQKPFSIVELFWGIITFITLFFTSLVNPSKTSKGSNFENDRRDRFRGTAGSGGWPGSGGPGGPSSRRRFGGMNRSSGISCPPMGGGG